jgi:inner membrane protein
VDTLTHALSGALLARALLRPAPPGDALTRQRVWVAFLAGAFPDIDYALSLVDPLLYLNLHQGLTHSLVLMPLWAAPLARLAARWYGRPWRDLYAAAVLGILAHIAADLCTAYGTQAFAPLSFARLSYPLAFVIDPYFTSIIALGLALSVYRDSPIPARLGLLALSCYLGFLGLLRAEALAIAHGYTTGLAARDVTALPQPFTPLNWKLLVKDAAATLHEAHLRLPGPLPAFGGPLFPATTAAFRSGERLIFATYPRFGADPRWTGLAREVWRQPGFAGFRRFARYPALYRVDAVPGELCVWFTDHRFTLPHLAPPFRYGMCRGRPDAPWRLHRLPLFGADGRLALG